MKPHDDNGSFRLGGSPFLDAKIEDDPHATNVALDRCDAYVTRRRLSDTERAELRAMLGAT